MQDPDSLPSQAALDALCRDVPFETGHAALLERLQAALPERRFTAVLSRGGWHRPAGIYRSDGTRVSADVEPWLDAAWRDCDEDGAAFVEAWQDEKLLVSRLRGQTHYFVAPTGEGPLDFLQLEIEEMQEEIERPLVDPTAPPGDLCDLLEPPRPPRWPHTPLGAPFYVPRRLTDIRRFVATLRGPRPEPSGVERFADEWAASSAAMHTPFWQHWLLACTEHIDRFHQMQRGARILPVATPEKPILPDPGAPLAPILRDFDRRAGYPAAWYFHMIAGARVPHTLATRFGRDWAQGLRYLPDRDAERVLNWLDRPYSA
ncbi:MAG: hypothetical protein AB1766_06455 [Pseudomonadota bacterium]